MATVLIEGLRWLGYLWVAHSEDVLRQLSVSDESDADRVWADVEGTDDIAEEVTDQKPVGALAALATDVPGAVHDQ